MTGSEPASTTPTAADQPEEQDRARDLELAGLKRKWQVALTTGLSLMALMYIPLPIDTMDWLMPVILTVATVVQFWAGKAFYAQVWAAARHGATNMDTLVALGTLVAYGYSTFATLWPATAQRWGLPLPCTSRRRFLKEEVAFRGALDAHVHHDGEGRGWRSAVFVSTLWGLWHLPVSHGLPFPIQLVVVHVLLGVPLSFAWRRTRNLA